MSDIQLYDYRHGRIEKADSGNWMWAPDVEAALKDQYEQGKRDALTPEIFDLWVKGKVAEAKKEILFGALARARLWYAVIFGLEALDNSVYDQFISTIRGDFHE